MQQQSSPQRLQYFDLLKGIAIFMVVIGHVLTIGIRSIDSAVLFKIVGLVHMPLFFFISGYFICRRDTRGQFKLPDLYMKVLQLIVPMVVVSSIWIYYYPHSKLESPFNSTWNGLWGDLWKNGYWFTLTLFVLNIAYLAIAAIANLCKNRNVAFLTASCSVFIILGIIDHTVPGKIGAITQMPFNYAYFPAFIAGALCRLYPDIYDRICNSSTCYTVALLATVAIAYFVLYPWDFPDSWGEMRDSALMTVRIFIAIVAVHLARPWCQKAGENNRWLKLWTYLGRKSLPIYLLHYFFLFPMGFVRKYMQMSGLDLVPTLTVAVLTASVIVAVTLAVIYILEKSPLLALLFTGDIPNQLKRKK